MFRSVQFDLFVLLQFLGEIKEKWSKQHFFVNWKSTLQLPEGVRSTYQTRWLVSSILEFRYFSSLLKTISVRGNQFTFLQRGSVKGLTLTAYAYHLGVHLRIP